MEGEISSRLYKLKFYCQICNKQLKDKDGFNCHLNSNYHKQNLEIVADNPQFYINNYSKEFETGFMDILKRHYPRHWVIANKVYQEYISDKNSTHMNATKWTTLTGFIKHLEANGKIQLQDELKDKDIKEVKIKYVDNTPQGIAEKSKLEKKKKEELYLQKLNKKKIEEQIQRDKEFENKKTALIQQKKDNSDYNKVKEDDGDRKRMGNSRDSNHNLIDHNKKIEISLNITEKPKVNLLLNAKKDKEKNYHKSIDFSFERKYNEKDNALKSIIDNFDRKINKNQIDKIKIDIKLNEANAYDKDNDSKNEKLLNKKTHRENAGYEEIKNVKSSNTNNIKGKFYSDFLDDDEESQKEKAETKDYFDKEDPWIKKDLIVRIKDANLAEGLYFDAKSLIIKVYDEFLAEVKVIDTETILRIDQEFLQPVIPKINSVVEILYGQNKGEIGILKEIDEYYKTALIDVNRDIIDEIINVHLNGICKLNHKKEAQ